MTPKGVEHVAKAVGLQPGTVMCFGIYDAERRGAHDEGGNLLLHLLRFGIYDAERRGARPPAFALEAADVFLNLGRRKALST